MSRTVLLLDVTAMAADAVCIAGIDLKSDVTVRLAEPQPTKRLLVLLGGITPGDVIDIDYRSFRKTEAPHVEDCEWTPRSLKKRRHADTAEVVQQLQKTSFASVVEAFGEPFEHDGERNAAWKPNTGSRSLANIRVREARLKANNRGHPRITFVDEGGSTWTSVPYQDVLAREHLFACARCRDGLARECELNVECGLIRVGLTRPYPADEASEPLCWLQVTNVVAAQREHFA